MLGTRYLMDGPAYPRGLASRGMAAAVPGEDDRRVVDEIIFAELVNGAVTDQSRREYVRVIENLATRGCDAVALACTEISLLDRSTCLPGVQADVIHTYIGDLSIALITPAGDRVMLRNQVGGGADDLHETWTSATPPALANLVGQPFAGRWTLHIGLFALKWGATCS